MALDKTPFPSREVIIHVYNIGCFKSAPTLRKRRRNGHQLSHAFGVAPCATVSSEGPAGRQGCFFIPSKGWFRTLSFSEQRRMWGLQSMELAPGHEGMKQLANGVCPPSMTAIAAAIFSVLDSIVCYNNLLARPLPFAPSCRADVISPRFDSLVAQWSRSVTNYTRAFLRSPDSAPQPPSPLVIAMDAYLHQNYWGYVMDLTTSPPQIVGHYPPAHNLSLVASLLPHFHTYDDQTLRTILDVTGVVPGSNTCRMITVLYPNHRGALLEHNRVQDETEFEIERDTKVRSGPLLPYVPSRCNPQSVVEKKGPSRKIRQIDDQSAGDGMSVNAWICLFMTWSLSLVSLDDIAEQYASLLPAAIFLNLPIYGFSTDLERAYRSVSVQQAAWWMQVSYAVDTSKGISDATFSFIIDKFLSFGGRRYPLDFSRISRFLRHCWSARVDAHPLLGARTDLIPLLDEMAASSTPTRSPSAPPPPAPGSRLQQAMAAIGTASVGFSRRRTPHHSSYRDYIGGGLASMPSAQPVPFKAPLSTANAFSSSGASSPAPTSKPLSPTALASHFDKCDLSATSSDPSPPLLPPTPDHPPTDWDHIRRSCKAAASIPWAPSTHKGVPLSPAALTHESYYLDDSLGLAVGLRAATVSRDICIAVGRELGLTFNEDKLIAGDVALVITHLGIVWDFTVTLEPTVSLTAAKTAANILLVDETLAQPSHIAWSTLLSLVGNLLNASYVVERGRIYCCGVLACVRAGARLAPRSCPRGSNEPSTSAKSRRTAPPDPCVALTPWALANLRWWRLYFSLSNAPPKRFLLPRPSYPGIVQSDASGKGWGGVFQTDTTLYVFSGRWSVEEQTLIDNGKLDINLTEMLTSYWLLALATPYLRGFVASIDCDNLQTVQLLARFRSRRRASALLLERIDLLLEQYQTRALWQHLPGHLNILSDRASRQGLDQTFYDLANASFPSLSVKDITAQLRSRRQTTWLLQAL